MNISIYLVATWLRRINNSNDQVEVKNKDVAKIVPAVGIDVGIASNFWKGRTIAAQT